jgi:alginate O-acetyltransferase complex protein AlgI
VSFVSFSFATFFVVVLAGLALMPTRAARQAFLLVANAVFYGSETPWFLLILALPSLVDYACALLIQESTDARARGQWLTLSLVVNLGILVYFKYANFFVDNISALFGVTAVPLDIVLPIGISFFTFKTMSYTIDVYRGRLQACRSLWRYAMFVSFFPELVAGPIVRASVFLPQMDRSLKFSWARTAAGIQIVLLGFTKKRLIADRLAIFADAVFANPGSFSQGTVLAGIVAYSLQIYCDFSGYSDMAIGVALIIGFDLPENFNMPYVATSITDFWRRWHITLSQWLRDFLYIPLGGNRCGPHRTYVNLMLTMLLGGLWHGAQWTFVIWGGLHGLGLAVHKFLQGRHERSGTPDRKPASFARTAVAWAATYGFVCLGWVFFRSSNVPSAMIMLRKAVGLTPGGIAWFSLPTLLLVPIVAAGHAIGIVIARRERSVRNASSGRDSATADSGHALTGSYLLLPRLGFTSAFVLTVWILALYLFVPLHRSPFIYFQF